MNGDCSNKVEEAVSELKVSRHCENSDILFKVVVDCDFLPRRPASCDPPVLLCSFLLQLGEN